MFAESDDPNQVNCVNRRLKVNCNEIEFKLQIEAGSGCQDFLLSGGSRMVELSGFEV